MAEREALTADYVRSILNYDPETGEFRWRDRTPSMFKDTPRRSKEHICNNWNAAFSGEAAGWLSNTGYFSIEIDGQNYRSHRLAWLFVNGRWPEHDIDHINRDRSDNRIANLREATRSQNAMNKGTCNRNTSGVKGVSWHEASSKWMARINVNKSSVYLGVFEKLEDAASAYEDAANRYYGAFARAE